MLFKHGAFQTLESMYESVYAFLKKVFHVEKQRVSIRVDIGACGDSVDVVPARLFDEETGDANLYVNYDPHSGTGSTSIKTNIKKHIKYISDSECRPTIKLMKVWKFRNNVNLKSFALELLVIEALKNSNSRDFAEQV